MRKYAPLAVLSLLALIFGSCANPASGTNTESTPVNLWTWMGGSTELSQYSVYGTQGLAAATNMPGARQNSESWIDSSGNFWLFGGNAYGVSTVGYMNDLWMYSQTTGLWTWVGGSTLQRPYGTYGTQGVASSSNCPGGRSHALCWTDSSGNFWMFGGYGYGASAFGDLNDLWTYSPTTNQWTWVGGSSTTQVGNYGTLGVAASTNMPGGRYGASKWIDDSGNIWVYGGYGYATSTTAGPLDDMWKYSPSTGLWTWMAGSTSIDQTGVYGTQGTAAADNTPGGRCYITGWVDKSGNLVLFGGYGYGSGSTKGCLNDMWKYSPSTGLWTWVGGSSSISQTGVYGTQGTAAATNYPGSRYASALWDKSSDTVWLFGGWGYGTTGLGYLNDLWKYSLTTGLWTWVGGSSSVGQTGVYGTQGTAAATNMPGGHTSAMSWTDSAGNLWLFGGQGKSSSSSTPGYFNDLWRYQP